MLNWLYDRLAWLGSSDAEIAEIVLRDLDLGEHDILVFCYSGSLTPENRDCLMRDIESALRSAKKVLVLDRGIQLKVIRRKSNELATH